MSDKNDVVIINLDRPRELWFGHKALKKMGAILNKDIDAAMQMDQLDLGELEKIMYCGLLRDAKEHNETLDLEQMEDLLDQGNFGEILEKMQEAFEKSFGNFQDASEVNNGKNSRGLRRQNNQTSTGNGAGKNL